MSASPTETWRITTVGSSWGKKKLTIDHLEYEL